MCSNVTSLQLSPVCPHAWVLTLSLLCNQSIICVPRRWSSWWSWKLPCRPQSQAVDGSLSRSCQAVPLFVGYLPLGIAIWNSVAALLESLRALLCASWPNFSTNASQAAFGFVCFSSVSRHPYLSRARGWSVGSFESAWAPPQPHTLYLDRMIKQLKFLVLFVYAAADGITFHPWLCQICRVCNELNI